MRRRFEGRGEKSKDAAEGTPVKSEMEEEASSETRISTVEKELIGLKEEATEAKTLLKLSTEGKRMDGGMLKADTFIGNVSFRPSTRARQTSQKSYIVNE